MPLDSERRIDDSENPATETTRREEAREMLRRKMAFRHSGRRNRRNAIIEDRRSMTDEELEEIYREAKRLARSPRNAPTTPPDTGLPAPWWLLAGISFAAFYLFVLVLLRVFASFLR